MKAVLGYLVGGIGFCFVIAAIQLAIIGGRPAAIRGRDVPAHSLETVIFNVACFAVIGGVALWVGKKLYEADEY